MDFRKLGGLISLVGVVVIAFGLFVFYYEPPPAPAQSQDPRLNAIYQQFVAPIDRSMAQAERRGKALSFLQWGGIITAVGGIISFSAKKGANEVGSTSSSS